MRGSIFKGNQHAHCDHPDDRPILAGGSQALSTPWGPASRAAPIGIRCASSMTMEKRNGSTNECNETNNASATFSLWVVRSVG